MSAPNAHHRLIHNLGHASLAPLVFLALLVWLVTPDLLPFVSMAMATYAALIVSFLGGVHWGAAWVHEAAGTSHEQDHQTPALWWGVSAPVLAWPGVLMPAHAGLVWLGMLMVVCYFVDRKLYPLADLQHWMTLRFRFSAVAAMSCFLAAGAL